MREKQNCPKIRNKLDWYEHWEKSTNFFFNLEKSRATQKTKREIIKKGNIKSRRN